MDYGVSQIFYLIWQIASLSILTIYTSAYLMYKLADFFFLFL